MSSCPDKSFHLGRLKSDDGKRPITYESLLLLCLLSRPEGMDPDNGFYPLLEELT
jgi:hypothetical protein